MNWKQTWDTIAASNASTEKQVGRVTSEEAGNAALLTQTAAHIARLLKLSATDTLLDVCCGNGALTVQLAKNCRQTTGIDFSAEMIRLANAQHSGAAVNYLAGDAKMLPELPHAPFDKICLNYSFQYFETFADGRKVVEGLLKNLKPGGLLLLGEVPDYEKRWNFYRTWLSRAYLVYHTLTGKNQMGKFWKQAELMKICAEFNVKGTLLAQAAHFPYAHYRFDFLIEKV